MTLDKENAVTTKANSSRSRNSRLPSAKTSSVFDRLYKSHTVASKAYLSSKRQTVQVKRNPRKITGTDDCAHIFTRLHITGTLSQTSKRRYGSKHPQTPKRKPRSRSSMSPAKTPSPRFGDAYMFSPRMKPLTKLTFKSRYHPGVGLETIQPLKLGFNFFQSFCAYEHGDIDEEQIAREIIIAFFKKDFPAGTHWVLHEPTIAQTAENLYNVSMSATFEGKRRRVASAQGAIHFLTEKREVRVENYLYDVTGDIS